MDTTSITDPVQQACEDLYEHGGQITAADAPYNPAALAVVRAGNTLRNAYDAVIAAGGRVEFVVDCPKCGEQASAGVTLFTDWVPGESLVIDLEMAAAQTTFTCDGCGNECYSGDYDLDYDKDGEPEGGAPDA